MRLSRLLGPAIALRERGAILADQPVNHGLAPSMEPLERARLMARQGICAEEGERHRVVEIHNYRTRQLVRVDLPPAHRLGRSGTRQATSVRAGIGHLQEV